MRRRRLQILGWDSLVDKKLGNYDIIDKLGQGGMGEVYRARDPKLDREVALKVLPENLADDPERIARFQREARTLASLHHPHIATLFGFEESAGQRFLVMELVEGEDLSQRIARGPVSIEDAVEIAAQIAKGLEAAHEKGIVHRDLKPANIKLAPTGETKILDFGLARAFTGDPESGESNLLNSPTLTQQMTSAGVILGTAAYMSPEQARGKTVDRRTDIWAFGVILYEMLTGGLLYEEETVSDTLASVLKSDPNWDALPPSTPPYLRTLLERCLEKNPARRLRDAGDVGLLLEGALEPTSTPTPVDVSTKGSRGRALVGLALTAAGIVLGIGVGRMWLSPTPERDSSAAFIIGEDDFLRRGSLAWSPDGTRLAFVGVDEDRNEIIYIRSISSFEPSPLPDSQGGRFPFWSPDGGSLAYFTNEALRRHDFGSNTARSLTNVTNPRGGSWSRQGTILFSDGSLSLYAIESDGANRRRVPLANSSEAHTAYCWPSFLPDGNQFIFSADAGSLEDHELLTAALDDSVSRSLRNGVRSAVQLDSDGYLFLSDNGQLVAQPLDIANNQMAGTPSVIADRVLAGGSNHAATFSVSPSGRLAYQTGTGNSEFVWVDRSGDPVSVALESGPIGNPRISPDGTRLAYERRDPANQNIRTIWVYEIERGVNTLISERNGLSDSAVWSPDSKYVYFDSDSSGEWQVHRRRANGSGEIELVFDRDYADLIVLDMSPNGRQLLYSAEFGGGGWTLCLQALEDSVITQWSSTHGGTETDYARFSPDGNWIIYCSQVSGQPEVYIQPTDPEQQHRRVQISSDGGYEPKWSRDGQEILYRSPRNDIVSVAIEREGESIRPGPAQELFGYYLPDTFYLRESFDLAPDGRVIMNWIGEQGRAPIYVETNWREGR